MLRSVQGKNRPREPGMCISDRDQWCSWVIEGVVLLRFRMGNVADGFVWMLEILDYRDF